ncbi:MAG: hypothetical protein BHW45_05200 [Roseburia sp. CAG:197_41_10]|nr:MAG: hypothetical protein BHW45_05200 [Roseburia sp. CAG:197_41_10]
MGKTKDVTTETTSEVHGTIFDDVFRTIAQKMPYLLIPLINEVFQTNYPEDIHFQQLRNEHYEKVGKIITDSILQIEDCCQSSLDGRMVIRMFEYDFSIALELAQKNNETFEIEFPQSCVLYIRNHREHSLPDYHEAIVKFADGQQILYRVPILRAQNYTVDSIFEKQLLILLPYHILRYESYLKNSGSNTKKLEQLLTDYQKISDALEQCTDDKKSALYIDIIILIEKIADHIIPKDNVKVRERLGDLMGGKILQLESERLREEGQKTERIRAIQNMISLGLTKEKILTKYSEEEYEEAVKTMLVEA